MKKIAMVSIMAVILGFLVYQGSMAFYHAETTVGTPISSGSLGIELLQTVDETQSVKTEDGYSFVSVMPGDVLKDEVAIKNAKENTLYVRVTATKYWMDKDNQKLPEADASLISLISNHPQDWIIIDDAQNSNSEIVYFYYKHPIKSNDTSTNLVDHIKIDETLSDRSYINYQVKLSFEADAVQFYAGKDAILSEWGVDCTMDENGDIISVDD